MKYNYTLNLHFYYQFKIEQNMITCLGVTMVRRDKYKQNSNLFTVPILKVLHLPRWKICQFGIDLGNNDYKADNWRIIFEIMVSAEIENLQIQRTYQEITLKSISQIQFGQLLQLNLQVNNIRNIEPLAKINAPSLLKLRLSHNLIVSARPLIKMRSKYLNQLMLEGNYIKDLDCISYMDFDKQLKLLSLENWHQKQCQVQNLSWLAKSRFNHKLDLYVGSKRRIKQLRVTNILSNKFLSLNYPKLIDF